MKCDGYPRTCLCQLALVVGRAEQLEIAREQYLAPATEDARERAARPALGARPGQLVVLAYETGVVRATG